MAKAEDLIIKIKTDDGQLQSGLNGTERKLNSFSDNIQRKVGGAIAATFATRAIINFGNEIIELAAIQMKAEAKVEQAIKQTGMAAGYSADQLKRIASGLQEITTFGDEDILNNVTAQLLSFTNVTGENFERAQKVIMDVSTLLDGDLKSAAIQVGKALNDPTTALSALTRSGIQFSAAQKEQIDSLIAANQLYEAQSIILSEIERQYGGQAEAMAKLPDGQLKQIANTWGDIKEEIGKAILLSGQFSSELQNLKDNMTVFFSDDISGFRKFVLAFDFTGKYIRGYANDLRKAAEETEHNNKLQSDYINYIKDLAAVKNPIEKHVKTIGELKTETEALKAKLDEYTIAQGAEAQATLAQIAANEKLIKSLTTLKVARESVLMLSGAKMETRTDLPQIGDNMAGHNTLMPEFDKIEAAGAGYMEKYKNLIAEQQAEVDALNERFSGALADSLAGGIEAAFSGQGLEATLTGFLKPLAGFLTTEGSMLIAHGIAVEAFKRSLTSFNGIPAIVAGAAMVATGAAFKGFVKGGLSGSGAGYSGSGGGYGSSGGGYGSTIGKQSIDITGRFDVDGNNLVYILNKTLNTNSRTRT
jgi:hypothetical protein